jgi:tetrahydromethanopterin S-methyltransferase subunit G
MSEEERIEAGKLMSEQEKNQIMSDFSKVDKRIDESIGQVNQSSEFSEFG